MAQSKTSSNPCHQNKDNDSLSSILSEIDNPSQKNKNHIFTNSRSSSFSSSSDSTSSSSSNKISTKNYPYNETDEDSVETKIKTFTKKLNKNSLKSKHLKKRKNSKLTTDKVCSQALQMIKFAWNPAHEKIGFET